MNQLKSKESLADENSQESDGTVEDEYIKDKLQKDLDETTEVKASKDDMTSAFYKNDNPKTRTTRLEGSDIETLVKRGWNLDKVSSHPNPTNRYFHYGVAENCKLCRRYENRKKNKNNKTTKPKETSTPRRFVHVHLKDLASLEKAWTEVPSGKMPVAYMAYVGGRVHMTVFYRPCTIDVAAALFKFGQQLMKDLPEAKVTIGEETDINSILYPDKKIYTLKVRLPAGVRNILKQVSLRKWLPHVTDHTNSLKIGDKIVLKPELELIYADINVDYDLKTAQSYDVLQSYIKDPTIDEEENEDVQSKEKELTKTDESSNRESSGPIVAEADNIERGNQVSGDNTTNEDA